MNVYSIKTACMVGLAGLLLTACYKRPADTPYPEVFINLPISLHCTDNTLQTRTDEQYDETAWISSLQLFLFEDSQFGEIYSREITITNNDSEPGIGTWIGTGALPKDDKQYRIVAIVNHSTSVTGSQMQRKKMFLDNLIFEMDDFDWSDGMPREPMPMWGESEELYTFTEDTRIATIPLIRAVASFDVVFRTAAADKFQLGEIVVKNYSTTGRHAPYDNLMDRELRKVTEVSLLEDDPVSLDMYVYYPSSYEGSRDEIFLPEYDNISKPEEERMQIIVGGTFVETGSNGYYYIPLIDKITGEAFDILRNHKYTITITNVDGEGYDTPEDALEAGLLTRSVVGAGIDYEITIE